MPCAFVSANIIPMHLASGIHFFNCLVNIQIELNFDLNSGFLKMFVLYHGIPYVRFRVSLSVLS